MNLGRKLINQISAGRCVAVRGRDLGSSTAGLSRTSQFLQQHHGKIYFGAILAAEVVYQLVASRDSVMESITKSDEAMRRVMKEKGVTREFCEAKIAKLKVKTKSLSASENDRFALQIYEGWLHFLTKS